MAIEKVNIAEKLSQFSDYFNPRIAGELSAKQDGLPGQTCQPWLVKLVKFKGEFIWHHHEQEDEMFYVVKGSFDMHLRDKIITVNQGEFIIMPKGTEHKPVAQEEVEIMLIEPATTLNTGNVINEKTKTGLQHI